MAGLQKFAILLSLVLPAAHGMYIGGAPMAAQPARFGGPMPVMGGGPGPFMGHHGMVMMPDLDQPDFHPHMFAMGHPGGPMGPMPFPGQPIMYGAAQSAVGARNPAVVQTGGRQVHQLPAQRQAVPVHHPQPVQPHAGAAHLSMAHPHSVHHPPTVQSHVHGAHPPMAQPRTVYAQHPPTVQSHAVGAHPSMAQSQAGSVHHLQPVQSQVGGAYHPMAQPLAGSTLPKPVHHSGHAMNHMAKPQPPQANPVVAQHPGGARHRTAAQPTGTVGTGQPGGAGPTTYHRTAAQQSPHGAAQGGQSSVGAAQPRLVQQGAQTRGHLAGHVAQAQPGAVAPLRVAARPQPPRMAAMPLSTMNGMAMRHGEMMHPRRGPFPIDGTYRTAQGTYTRDGSDLSFDPRY